ncbi:MAG: acyl-CoA thioesterase [Bacteroidaceae bacterium]|nr:acyl-CoA thioesterase [Bacteroidaceae bacterium]
MNRPTYTFELPMQVRDYECDLEGIVNNANYLHYLEHTRHQFLLREGISFVQLHRQGVDVVVARITISYKTPLQSDDEFVSCLNVSKEGPKYIFQQDIYRQPDGKPVVRARVEAVCTMEGRLCDYAPLMDIFGKYLK